MLLLLRLVAAAGLMLATGSFAGHAQSVSDSQRGENAKIVREYLSANPEMQDATNGLRKREPVVERSIPLGSFANSADTSPNDLENQHLSHDPGLLYAQAAGASPSNRGPGMGGMGPPAGVGPPAGAGGMSGGMGSTCGMGGMCGRGTAPPKEMYPSLMALPEFSPEKRREVDQRADERMHTGSVLMGQALESLNAGSQSGDYVAMHEAAARLREGIAQLESGVAAKRALAEGRAPREVALAWFKQEMKLARPVMDEASPADRGLSFIHLFTMALLAVFAFGMLILYLYKIRRAAALFARVEPGKGPPPPGSAPPLAGGGGSPGGKSPPDGKTPPTAKPGADKAPALAAGEKPPPPASPDEPAESAEPPAEKPPTPALPSKAP